MLEELEYFDGGQVLAFFIVDRGAEVLVEELFFQGYLLELGVAFGCFGFFFFREPVALTGTQGGYGLGVKLGMIYRVAVVDGALDFYAEVTATSGWIGQQVEVVAGSDKGGIAFQYTGAAFER